VPDILELPPFDVTGLHRQARSGPFQRLDTGHLVDRNALHALLGGGESGLVDRADIGTLGVKVGISLRRQPVTVGMRLEIGLFLRPPNSDVRGIFDDAACHGLPRLFALAPMTDRHVEGLGIFAGKRRDLADHFRRNPRRRTTARRIAQTGRDPSGWHCIAPPTSPVTGRLAPNPQSLRGFVDPHAGCRRQDDPSSFRQASNAPAPDRSAYVHAQPTVAPVKPYSRHNILPRRSRGSTRIIAGFTPVARRAESSFTVKL
jgi:hypothetical protein